MRDGDVERRFAQLDGGDEEKGEEYAGQLQRHELRRCHHARERARPGHFADARHHQDEERLRREQDDELALGSLKAIRRVDGARGQDQQEGSQGEDESDEDQVSATEEESSGDCHEAEMSQEERLRHGIDLAGFLLQKLADIVERLK